ncbi:MAG: prolyl oligopeptidase [Frankiaceae bacterium]|nr:prolyl oligopeptidase [Frankiaceae bacterium]
MLSYPPTRRDSTADVLHGETVADPYRWLEDTYAADTTAWVAAQNALTDSVLSASPSRDEIRARLTEVWDYPRRGVPYERASRWFQQRNTGLQPQAVLYVMDSADDEGRVLLDPNTLSADGTVALMATDVSPDGRLLAYATSASGSDWMTWRIREIDTGSELPDVLEWSRFSGVAWTPDSAALLYVGYDEPETGQEFLAEVRIGRVALHRLGRSQRDDVTVWSAPDQPEWIPSVSATPDGSWAVIFVAHGTFPENQLHVVDLADSQGAVRPLVPGLDCEATYAGNVGTTFYLSTDADAARRRIVAVDLDDPERANWRTVVAESTDTLTDAHLFGGRLVAHYLEHAHSSVRVFALDGERQADVELPGIVTVSEMSGRPERDVIHLGVTSFTDSGSLWAYDLSTGSIRRTFAPAASIDTDSFVTDQAFVESTGGARVPVFLVHRNDVTPTGDVPVLLYGYGGFNIPLTPAFSALRAVWVERGGVYAVANLRGGGEYGREWYDAGRRASKQNVFDDFAAVARWLGGDSGWSRPDRVAIHGGSNGGLLVGACLTQHPELFGATVPAVGVLDMLRFHRFTIGWAWTSDYGDPDDPEQYQWVRAYSPLHNVRPGTAYPPTLVLTGDHDDRVAPGHSFKFAAALQAAQSGDAPILIRIDTSAGHGAGKPTQKLIDEGADLLTFLESTVSGRMDACR